MEPVFCQKCFFHSMQCLFLSILFIKWFSSEKLWIWLILRETLTWEMIVQLLNILQYFAERIFFQCCSLYLTSQQSLNCSVQPYWRIWNSKQECHMYLGVPENMTVPRRLAGRLWSLKLFAAFIVNNRTYTFDY